MTRNNAWKLIPIVSAALLALTLPASATPQQDAIAARKAGFKKMGGAMKALNEQIKSGTIVKATAVAAAQELNATARQQGALFPAGSGPGAGVKTDALPAIWSQRAAFDARMNQLVGESAKLVTAANTGDASALGAQWKATGGVCAACHKQFRVDDD